MKLALTAALLLHVAWLVAAQDVLKDASPHRQEFVSVDDSTRLEVLDWGGTGRSLVFLSGIGDTAHVFDTFAPRFSNRFRVIGITRRGFGASSRPLSGYTVPRLAKDIESVLDALHIHEPVLIGHSIAGEEMSYIAARKSIRLGGLVYLDAAYDHTRPDALIKVVVPRNLQPSPVDRASRDAYQAFWLRTRGFRWPDSELDQFETFGDPPPSVSAEILGSALAPEYGNVTAPALAIYVEPRSVRDLFPAYDDYGPTVRPELDAAWPKWTAAVERDRRRFRREVRHGEAVAVAARSHYLFLSNDQEVASLVDRFLQKSAWRR